MKPDFVTYGMDLYLILWSDQDGQELGSDYVASNDIDLAREAFIESYPSKKIIEVRDTGSVIVARC